jgi:hypothetical protein
MVHGILEGTRSVLPLRCDMAEAKVEEGASPTVSEHSTAMPGFFGIR